MHYRAIAEHLAARCRAALRAEGPNPPSKTHGGLWVGKPQKATDIRRTGESYSFGVGEMNSDTEYYEAPAHERRRWLWRGYIVVTKGGDVFIEPAEGEIPSEISGCFETR